MYTTVTQKSIYLLAEKIGVSLSDRNPRLSYMWDTHTIGIGGLSYSNQLHELGHWLTSTQEMRRMIDFGLGPGPETGLSVPDVLMGLKGGTYEEEASLLGIAYEACLELPYLKTLQLHNWHNETTFWVTIRSLQDKGLLQDHLPTIRL